MVQRSLLTVVVAASLLSSVVVIAQERTGGSTLENDDQTYTLVAKPDGQILTAPDNVRPLPTPVMLRPGTPLARVVATRDGVGSPLDSLLNPIDPQPSAECEVDFSDYDALNLLTFAPAGYSPYGETTFTFVPWWFQDCPGLGNAVVRPIADEGDTLEGLHFHLSYEDPDITACFSFADWGILQEDGTCVDFDPREKGRGLLPHSGHDAVELYVSNGFFHVPFTLERLRVLSDTPARVCYKPYQTDDGAWETAEPGGTLPGIWLCWNALGTGYWDLSTYAANITDVRIFSTNDIGPFKIDDIRLGPAY